MGVLRKVTLTLLATLLILLLMGANLAVAADRTAMNPHFISDSLEEEGVYADFAEDMQAEMAEDLGGDIGEEMTEEEGFEEGAISFEHADGDEIAAAVVTEEYVASEMQRNLVNFYAFLEGEMAVPEMWFDLTPLQDELEMVFAPEHITVDSSALAAGMDLQVEGIDVDRETLDQMRESEAGYKEVRTDVRVQVAFDEMDNAELLVLIDKNPQQYDEEEREQKVTENEEEIREALREELGSYDDLDDELQQEVDERNEQLKAELEAEIREDTADEPEALTDALVSLQATIVDGFTGDLSHAAYTDRLADDEAAIESAFSEAILEEVDEDIPDEIDLMEDVGEEEAEEEFGDVQMAFGFAGTTVLILPVVVLLLVGLVFALTQTFAGTAKVTGASFAIAGLGGLVTAYLIGDVLLGVVEEELAANGDPGELPMEDVLLSIMDGIGSVLGSQSIALLVVGVGLVGLAFADGAGKLDDLRAKLGRDPVGSRSATAESNTEPAVESAPTTGGPETTDDAVGTVEDGNGAGATDARVGKVDSSAGQDDA